MKAAGSATYATGGKETLFPERPGFIEYDFTQGDFSYKDSFTGWYRSRGTETVRFQGMPVFAALYGGGMIEGKESLAEKTFDFLKVAMQAKNESIPYSFRGPDLLENGDWKYTYTQEGDISDFFGYEEITYQGEVVFFHRIIGGIVVGK